MWWLTLLACTRAPESLWFGGDVYLGEPRPWLDDALRVQLPNQGVINLEAGVGAATGADPQVTNGSVRLVHDAATLDSFRGVWADIANNHFADGDADGLSRLTDLGLKPFGGAAGRLDAGGGSIAGVDLSAGLPPDLAEQVANARIVVFHTDGEPSPKPSATLETAVEIALIAGAQVVVAHGTHAWAPVERRGDAIIAWGLGNLAFDCHCTNGRDALIVSVDLSKPRPEAVVIPIEAGLYGAPARASRDPAAILELLHALGSDIDAEGHVR